MDLELSVKVQHEAGLRAALDYRTPHIVIDGVNQHASCVPETHGGKFLIVSKLNTPTFWRLPRLAVDGNAKWPAQAGAYGFANMRCGRKVFFGLKTHLA